MDFVVGDPLVAEYIRKQLTSADAVNLNLWFNERGLDIRATEIAIQRKPKAIGARRK